MLFPLVSISGVTPSLLYKVKTVPAGKVFDGMVMSNESVPLPVFVTTSVNVTMLPCAAELMVSMPFTVASLSFAATPVSLMVTAALWRTVKL